MEWAGAKSGMASAPIPPSMFVAGNELNQTHTQHMTKLYKVKHNCKEKADIKTPTTEYGDVMSSCLCVYELKLKP